MSDGWAVKVTRQAIDGSAPQIEIWYAAIADRIEAENTVREHLSAPAEASVAAERPMTAAALKSMGLNDGQISQWS